MNMDRERVQFNDGFQTLDAETPPGGFTVPTYLENVKDQFTDKFITEPPTPLVKAIAFAEVKDFEHIDIELPAIILDLEGAKLNPTQGEYEHRGEHIYSNLGELELYATMKASILVSTRCRDPQTTVRTLAFDVAGYVTEASRFQSPTGMSQVTEIRPEDMSRRNAQNHVEWYVRWAHSISLGNPDYRGMSDNPAVDATHVISLQIGLEPYTENDITDRTDAEEHSHKTRYGYDTLYVNPPADNEGKTEQAKDKPYMEGATSEVYIKDEPEDEPEQE